MEHLKSQILHLSDADRIELLRWFISQLAEHPVELDQLVEAFKRVQEWDEGKIKPLSEEEFWSKFDKALC